MRNQDFIFAPHLSLQEVTLPPAGEWTPALGCWAVMQAVSGSGYWMGAAGNQEIESGAVFVIPGRAKGIVRASQLGELIIQHYFVDPARLPGLLSLEEQRYLEASATNERTRICPAHGSMAVAMKELCATRNRQGALFRLRLLQLFVEAFGDEMGKQSDLPAVPSGAKERLQEFLDSTPATDLLHLSASELARLTRCTPRHLNRIFNDIVGVSYREKHTELRLARACELLSSTDSKVVDVAMESGYQSLSLFNQMFKERFGTSPGRWRQTFQQNKRTAPRRIGRNNRLTGVLAGS